MKWVHVAYLGKHAGDSVTIKGWVVHLRSSGKIKFVTIRDGTGVIQCVVTAADSPAAADLYERLTQETSVVVTGTVREDKRAPGGYELTVTDLEMVQGAPDFPITPKEHGVAFLMENRHLWLRSSRQHATLRIRA